MNDPKSLADEVLKAHRNAGGLTLAVVNTVRRARELARELQRRTKSADPGPAVILIHSRFRPPDRRERMDQLLAPLAGPGLVAVTTQVVEAGVDVSATTLFTELAPWASLVQRFGRCNRRGHDNDKAQVFWVDLPAKQGEQERCCGPYQPGDLQQSRQVLGNLTKPDVGPGSLPANVPLAYPPGQVLRRKDFTELFDTTPDLAGNDLDIERFVRDVEECDVRVFWRDWPADTRPPADLPAPRHDELCAAPVGEFREFARETKRRNLIYRWDHLEGSWEPLDNARIFPGQVFLVHACAGGYTSESGWNQDSLAPVPVLPPPPAAPAPEANDTDSLSQSRWESIAEHTNRVCGELETILKEISIEESSALRLAARWHDRGKAHAAFVARLSPEALAQARAAGVLNGGFAAKAPPAAWLPPSQTAPEHRSHFRHELASALAVLMAARDQIPDEVRDLVAYLVAAHHGKLRLSIRSLPGEKVPSDGRRFARGIWDQDDLPSTDLGGGVQAPAVKLSLEPMELGLCEQPPFQGQPSWAERMLRLRDTLGPCRLARLEALLRAADMRASAGLAALPASGNAEAPAGSLALREEAGSQSSTPALSIEERSLVAELVEEGLSIQSKFRPEPLYKQTGKGHFQSGTVEEIQSAKRPKAEGGRS
jgi:CRISPR-associated endonuclease/helicase Cas3